MSAFAVFWLGTVAIYLFLLGLGFLCFWDRLFSDTDDIFFAFILSIVPLINMMLSCLFLFLIGSYLVENRRKITDTFIRMIS